MLGEFHRWKEDLDSPKSLANVMGHGTFQSDALIKFDLVYTFRRVRWTVWDCGEVSCVMVQL